MGDTAITPFAVEVPDPEIDDLRSRLRATRWPSAAPAQGWTYGTDLAYLQDLCGYWAEEFDWRAQEACLNAFSQFTTVIDGEQIHFVHARSSVPDATPLLLSHGWPGSVVEFLHIIGPLTDPESHGGDPADACHVIAPSLPGYGFSGPTTQTGWDPARIADCFAELMARLGYERFVAQGGDWGSMITTQLGLRHPDRLTGIHLNMMIAAPPEGITDFTDEELAALTEAGAFLETGSGYSAIQGTRPQTIGYALTDSPAGLAGWIVEKFREWTDNDGSIESAVDRDDLLANLSVYWFTRTASSSARLYYEARESGLFGIQPGVVTVPTGAIVFPVDLVRPSRRFAEARFDIVHWTEPDRGGHFAALEQPELLVEDIRSFIRGL
jgi:pimeloyl-ACP methyl ester carboxylesterase